MVQQPFVQPAGVMFPQQGGQGGTLNGPSNPDDVRKIMDQFKVANSIRIKYLEPNFRGEGGFKFAIYLRGSSE